MQDAAMNSLLKIYLLLSAADAAATLSDHSTSHCSFLMRRIEALRHVLNEGVDVHFLHHFVELLFGRMLRVIAPLQSNL